MNEKTSKISLVLSMMIFGTIGIFRRYIPLSSSMVALVRGFIGTLFLLVVVLAGKNKIDKSAIKKNLAALCISGAFIGINWILLFESYRYTTVATATLCYYMAPIFVIIVSPFILKEKLSLKKMLCVLVALVGMVFVSGVVTTGIPGISEAKGILFGIGAAVFYASVILINKKITDISSYDKTIMQLACAAITIVPYVLITEDISTIQLNATIIFFLIVVGIVHTGIAYVLYFGSMNKIKAQTVALFSYIDPVVAIILSAVLLKEKIDIFGIIGAIMVLGSTLISEFVDGKENNE